MPLGFTEEFDEGFGYNGGPNVPNADTIDQITLGRGELLFAPFTTGTLIHTGYRSLGNCSNIVITPTIEKLDHMDSRQGIKQRDISAMISQAISGSFTADHITRQNLARLFNGTSSIVTQTSLSSQTTTITGAVLGNTYQLGETAANPSGHRNVTSVVVTSTSPSVTYVLNTDYELDAALGLITLLTTGAGAGLNLTVTYNVSASTREQVRDGTNQIVGAMKFIARNPVGPNRDFAFPYVNIQPGGDLGLIGDDFMSMNFNYDALKLGNANLLYIDGRAA